ncbi:MAG TPA: GNAT family N-acyltransferase, partial [Blastocatellia bacterium]|nr:GNAT family N-acyltransferase [Blastocatellia bacterium]HMV82832.1 GNAT family N-acyltransferase [Blastocatellia bacterium]HMX25816.1 GNAT family N-acyltransferase [Blastocatellia bacterium]HMY76104.1 GNAT family N-acyltransferase [Blastocatellia bacterium]HNG29621.1 GNAT family N-acyltransferase [Blastocatellia bacterium]
MIEIKLINNPQELQQVFRLRYAVYIEELGAEMEFADHERKELREPWDETGDNLGAWINGELVGCLRINYGGQSDLSEYRDFFDPMLAGNAVPLESISVSSKFAVHRRHRGATLTVRLAQASYVQFQEKNSRLNYLTCRPNLAEMYRKL